ncbi:MAG: hypothetical protein WBE78_03185, partial [Candidatus Binataceae bacterium]
MALGIRRSIEFVGLQNSAETVVTRARQHHRAARRVNSITVGVDTGGTFTDLVAIVDGSLRVHKV